MEVFKIKISPEVLRNDLTLESYSGVSFGYYSGLTKYLSQTVETEYYYMRTSPTFPGGFLVLLGDFTPPIGYDDYKFIINQFSSYGQDTRAFFQRLKIGQKITIILQDDSIYEYYLYEPPTRDITSLTLSLNLISINTQPSLSVPANQTVIFNIIQENISSFNDLSVPILFKQDYEDLGYYSPFDGYISQLTEEVNFIFTANTINPFDVLIYNTSISGKTYLQNSTFVVNWGDGTPIENVEVVVPESLIHTYTDIGITTGYTITFTGYTSIGSYVVKKNITLPYSQAPIVNPFGTVEFQTNNLSWSATPTSQNFIATYDSENTIADQVSSNFVSVPFIVSGFTESRLEELKIYGPNPYVTNLTINLADGTTGIVTSQSPEYTAYTINDQSYLDFSAGTSVFVAQSYGLTDNSLTATSITKLEYLMNVIDQPIIQSNVFIERGKISGMENFRRIGEINNTGSLSTYGYKFFDVRNYNDI